MPRYDFRCASGHVTEAIFPMADVPESIPCDHCGPVQLSLPPSTPKAFRVFGPPAAIHFKGPGFYATDVTGRLHRKRRPNPGDDLHKEHQPDTARIADAI